MKMLGAVGICRSVNVAVDDVVVVGVCSTIGLSVIGAFLSAFDIVDLLLLLVVVCRCLLSLPLRSSSTSSSMNSSISSRLSRAVSAKFGFSLSCSTIPDYASRYYVDCLCSSDVFFFFFFFSCYLALHRCRTIDQSSIRSRRDFSLSC
jgi:hypothetical protein